LENPASVGGRGGEGKKNVVRRIKGRIVGTRGETAFTEKKDSFGSCLQKGIDNRSSRKGGRAGRKGTFSGGLKIFAQGYGKGGESNPQQDRTWGNLRREI